MRNNSVYAWRLNFCQLLLGLLFAFFYDTTAVATVLIFFIAQSVFTYCAFSRSGAGKRQEILKFFFLGEALKIFLFAAMILILTQYWQINFSSLVITTLYLQIVAFLGPIALKLL